MSTDAMESEREPAIVTTEPGSLSKDETEPRNITGSDLSHLGEYIDSPVPA